MNQTCLVPANSRGGTILLHGHYRFRRKSVTASKYHWICTDTNCHSRLQTNCFDYNAPNIIGTFKVTFLC